MSAASLRVHETPASEITVHYFGAEPLGGVSTGHNRTGLAVVHILALEGDSHLERFEGNFEMYEKDKRRRLGADSLITKRIKFQKVAR